MKIHNVSGCLAFSLNVDGIEEIDMTDKQRQKVIKSIYEWLKNNPDQLNYVLQALTQELGEYNVINSTPCECCGDIVDEYVWEI